MPLSANGFNAVVELGQTYVRNPAARLGFFMDLFDAHRADGGDIRFFQNVPDSDLMRDPVFADAVEKWTANNPS